MFYKNADCGYVYERVADTWIVHDNILKQVVDRTDDRFLLRRVTGEVDIEYYSAIDFSTPRLGFFNMPGGYSIYVCRVPKRRDWRQGIRPANLTSFNQGRCSMVSSHDIQNIATVRLNRKPSIPESIEMIEDTHTSVAVGNKFCVTDRGEVWYKGMSKVGTLNVESETIQLSRQYVHLQESLDQDLEGN